MSNQPKPVTPVEYQTIEELVKELKSRCRSVVLAVTLDGRDGPETVVDVDGSMIECRGMAAMLVDRTKNWTDGWFGNMDAEDAESDEHD